MANHYNTQFVTKIPINGYYANYIKPTPIRPLQQQQQQTLRKRRSSSPKSKSSPLKSALRTPTRPKRHADTRVVVISPPENIKQTLPKRRRNPDFHPVSHESSGSSRKFRITRRRQPWSLEFTEDDLQRIMAASRTKRPNSINELIERGVGDAIALRQQRLARRGRMMAELARHKKAKNRKISRGEFVQRQ